MLWAEIHIYTFTPPNFPHALSCPTHSIETALAPAAFLLFREQPEKQKISAKQSAHFII